MYNSSIADIVEIALLTLVCDLLLRFTCQDKATGPRHAGKSARYVLDNVGPPNCARATSKVEVRWGLFVLRLVYFACVLITRKMGERPTFLELPALFGTVFCWTRLPSWTAALSLYLTLPLSLFWFLRLTSLFTMCMYFLHSSHTSKLDHIFSES